VQSHLLCALLPIANDQKGPLGITAMRRTALLACLAAGLVTFTATLAAAYSYRRPQDAATPGAPVQVQNGHSQNGHSQNGMDHQGQSAAGDVNFAWNGMEGPAYSYGYALNMPADGNWRWIEARCYGARSGQVCVDGHWLRRTPGRCEEVSSHSVRQGQYIRIVPNGPVNTCRR
jgi:hypothetical protein